MKYIYFGLVIFSELVTAAHFYRWGNYPLVAVFLFSAILPFIKKKISYYSMQLILFLEIIVWSVTTYKLFLMRVRFHEPYLKMLIILFSVIMMIFFLFIVSFAKKIKHHFSD